VNVPPRSNYQLTPKTRERREGAGERRSTAGMTNWLARLAYEGGMWYLSWKASRMLMNCAVRRARASLAILSGTPP